jgi:hypothetical protein
LIVASFVASVLASLSPHRIARRRLFILQHRIRTES